MSRCFFLFFFFLAEIILSKLLWAFLLYNTWSCAFQNHVFETLTYFCSEKQKVYNFLLTLVSIHLFNYLTCLFEHKVMCKISNYITWLRSHTTCIFLKGIYIKRQFEKERVVQMPVHKHCASTLKVHIHL